MAVKTSLSNTGTLTLSDPFTGSVYFDGNGDYLTIPSDYTITGDFTAEAFVYNTGVNDPCILGTLDSANSQLLRILGGVQIAFFASTITGTIPVPTNQWVHLAVSRQGTTVRLFTNGSLSQTATFGGNVVFRYIGALSFGNDLLTGYISNLRVINGRAIYTSSFTPPNTSLSSISNTVLLTCQGPTIKDSSPNNFTITSNGNAAYSNFSRFIPTLSESVIESGSIFFNNDSSNVNLPLSSKFNISANQNFTLECWVYLSSARSDYAYMVDFIGDASYILQLRIGNAGFGYRVQAAFGPGASAGSVYNNASYTQTNLLNKWTHLALCRSGDSATFFFDGVGIETKTGVGSISFSNVNTARLGRPSPEIFHGYISNVKFTVGTALYTQNFSPSAKLNNEPNTQLLIKSSTPQLWLKDNSINNFTLTTTGSPSYSSQTPEIDLQYSSAGSVYFDGNGDFLSVPTITITGDFTIECWIYIVNQAANPCIVGYFDGSINRQFLRITSGKLTFYSQGDAITGTTTLVNNTWYHVAVSKQGTTVRSFVNGNLEGSVVANRTEYVAYIGQLGLGNLYFTGYISNVRIINGQALYISNFISPITPLTNVANTNLLTCQGPKGTIADASSNNLTVTKNGDVGWRADNPFNIVNSSLNLDGIAIKEIDEVSMNSGSVFFNGSGNPGWLSTPSNNAFTFGTGDFTIEAWVYLATGTAGTIFDNRTSTTSLHPVIILANGGTGANDRISFYVAGFYPIISNVVPLTSTWTHVALCKLSGSTRLFINGVQSGSTYSDSNNYAASGTVLIGAGLSGANQLNGYISNIRVLKGTALYTANFTPQRKLLDILPNTSLLLNCVSGQEFKDSSTNNFTVTQNSTIATSTLTPFTTTSTVQKLFTDGTLLVKEFIES